MLKRFLLSAAALLSVTISLPAPASEQIFTDDDLFQLQFPATGRWGPRDGSRTGLFLEYQNGRVAGLLAGYNESGEPRWFSFSGQIDWPERPDPDAQRPRPRIEARLWEFSGGGCIVPDSGCALGEASDFQGEETPLWIIIRPYWRSLAEYEIWHSRSYAPRPQLPPAPPLPPAPTTLLFGPADIIPLTFGVAESAESPGDPLVRLPDLEGVWLTARVETTDDFVGEFELSEPLADSYTGASILRLGEREIERFEIADPAPDDVVAEVRHAIIDDPDQLFPTGTVLVCEFKFEHVFPSNIQRCIFREPPGNTPLDDSTSSIFQLVSNGRMRFIKVTQPIPAGSLDWVRLDFFRLNHD